MLDNRIFVLLTVFTIVYVLQKLVKFRRTVRSLNNWPGFRTIFNDRFLFFPFRVPGIAPGPHWSFYTKYDEFAKAGWDVISAVNVLPTVGPTYYIADPMIAREVVGARARFPKPLEAYTVLASFGSNIVVTEGDEWKRQRKVAAPAFSEKNNRLVWDETIRVCEDMFQNVWGNASVIELDHIMDITVPITQFIISVAGFGKRISWNDTKAPPPGHAMTFKDALSDVSHRLFLKLLFPEWMLRWGPSGLRSFAHAYDEIERYLIEMVQTRKTAEVKEERYDLFSSLLDANEGENDTDAKLSNSELLGNIFIFLVAGYETTAHTLAFAFVLLALYQDEQEAFYQNIKAALPSDRLPTYDDFSSLSYALAVLNETLRWFPPVINVPKESAEDTTFTTTNAAGEKQTLPVPQGTAITLCIPSMHHNPRYWDEPEAFKPARFLGDYPRDAFLAFSGGPRGCIGRKFAETEGVAALALIISRYKVEVKEEPQFSGETFVQRKARLLKCQHSLTIFPERAPLVFRRR